MRGTRRLRSLRRLCPAQLPSFMATTGLIGPLIATFLVGQTDARKWSRYAYGDWIGTRLQCQGPVTPIYLLHMYATKVVV